MYIFHPYPVLAFILNPGTVSACFSPFPTPLNPPLQSQSPFPYSRLCTTLSIAYSSLTLLFPALKVPGIPWIPGISIIHIHLFHRALLPRTVALSSIPCHPATTEPALSNGIFGLLSMISGLLIGVVCCVSNLSLQPWPTCFHTALIAPFTHEFLMAILYFGYGRLCRPV